MTGKWVGGNYVRTYTMQEVRGSGMLKADDSCVNHLFTHTDFNTGTLGVANVGAICRTPYGMPCHRPP